MNDLINFNFKKNNCSYDSKKKNVLLIIKKSPNEIDWILPIIFKLKEKFNIITVFKEKILYKNLKKKKKIFKLWSNISCHYTFHPLFRNLELRILLKLLNFLNSKFKNKFNKLFDDNYYNYRNFINQFRKKINIRKFSIDLLFIGIHNKSYWPEIIEKNNKNLKIFAFPEQISFSTNKKIITKKSNHSNKTILVHSKNHLKSLKKIFFIKKYLIVNYPKFSNEWLNIILNKKFINKNQILIMYKGYDNKINDKKIYDDQIKSIISWAKKYNLELIFNVHPYSDLSYLKKLIKSQNYDKIKYSYNSPLDDINQHDKILNMYGTNIILDCIALNKTPFELWSTLIKKNTSVYKKYSILIKKTKELNRIFDSKLGNKKIKIKKKIFIDNNLVSMLKNIYKTIKTLDNNIS